jgi:DNA-binding NarL/FixJ family response regulator
MVQTLQIERTSDSDAAVLIASDQSPTRAGLQVFAEDALGRVGVREAVDWESLVRTVQTFRSIRLALIDLNMAGAAGLSRLADVARQRPDLSLVIFASVDSHEIARQAYALPSACAVVAKNAPPSTIRFCILAGMQKQRVTVPAADSYKKSESNSLLTPRQRQIRILLRQGMSNKIIAATLNISEGTVKNHLTEIYRALNATNRMQAAQFPSELD